MLQADQVSILVEYKPENVYQEDGNSMIDSYNLSLVMRWNWKQIVSIDTETTLISFRVMNFM